MSDAREEGLFEGALRLALEERGAYLDRECAGDVELRRRVELLISAFERASDFMKEPVAGREAMATVEYPVEKAGDRIGRYKLLQKIGEGGCGIVYMAEQEEPVRRRVALKIIKLGMDTREVIARFEAERQALALMDHPNIAKVLDAGATETGRPYFVMELVRGTRITEFCDAQSLSTDERLTLFVQVCHAVQHAHQKGIIHRDLKPSNILVTSQDGVAMPKVIDFGIAKATAGSLTDKTLFTAFEQFIGTPAYMSPEQAEMSALDIDTRSDIYSLGVLLYELLTGRTPFDQKELLAAGLDAMRRVIREEEPKRPSTRLSTLLAADLTKTARQRQIDAPKLIHLIRGDLDWVVMKCLEKDRARRYETANGLAQDIRRRLNNEPVTARPPSKLYRFQKSVSRNKVAFAAAGAVLIALITGLCFSTWALMQERRARERAVAAEKKSESVAQLLKEMLEGVAPSVALGRDTTVLQEILDKTAERIDKELKNQPEVEIDIRGTLGGVYSTLEKHDQSAAMHQRAFEIARARGKEDDETIAMCLWNLGGVSYNKGEIEEAEKQLRKAWGILRRVGKGESEEATRVMSALALTIGNRRSRFREAADLYTQTLAIQRKIYPRDHPNIGSTLTSLANLSHYEGRLGEAEALLKEALAINKKAFPEGHPAIADTLQNLAALLQRLGKTREAEDMYRQSLAMQEKVQKESSHIALLLHNLATLLRGEHRLDEAESLELKAIPMYKKAMGLDPLVYLCLGNLALIRAEKGDLEKAEEYAREGIAVSVELDGREDVGALHTLAYVLLKRNKLVEAENAARRATEHHHPDDYHGQLARLTWGRILLAQKKRSEAEEQFRKGVNELEKHKIVLMKGEKARVKEACEQLAAICEGSGRAEEAAKWKQKAAEFEPSLTAR